MLDYNKKNASPVRSVPDHVIRFFDRFVSALPCAKVSNELTQTYEQHQKRKPYLQFYHMIIIQQRQNGI